MKSALWHGAAGALFVALAVVWTWPLVSVLGDHLPGAIGDNVQFLWNSWWMRTALASDLDFFRTPYLFAPLGTDLTLHTHTALPAFLGATFLGALPLVMAHNVVLLAALALNGFCAYLLALRLTSDHLASLVAGLAFGGSPYIAAHLNGHFNLTGSAWSIPLFALFLVDVRRGCLRAAVLAGLVMGVTAYVDYYAVVFQLALVALTSREWSLVRRGPTPRTLLLARAVMVLVAMDLAFIAAIAFTGGFKTSLGPIRVSARDTFNPSQILWLLVALAVWLLLRPKVSARQLGEGGGPVAWHRLGLMFLAFAVVAAPVLWHGTSLVLRGEYVSQRYFWRSAPKGVDLATLLLGNPYHGLWGGWVRQIYARFGIVPIEAGAWMGVPLLLAGWAVRSQWAQAAVRLWTSLGIVFFVWALGPHLMAFGANTGMILPQSLLRLVPIIANARVPGRAMVVVSLAVAVLAALALAGWRPERGRRGMLSLVAVAVVLDFVPAPFPLARLDRPLIYETLRLQKEIGSVLELPVGTRDSFQRRGTLDHRVIAYQALHERPLVGGMVSRLSPRVIRAYEADPLIAALLRLSETPQGSPDGLLPPDRERAAQLLEGNGVAFVMLNRATAPPALVAYVEQVLPLALVASEHERSLYRVAR